ncbi:MAG: primosomal protein N' [Lachnospiraceae bacterium]|nr:primosomal protein N' [Lachnospiraceae bacterium]
MPRYADVIIDISHEQLDKSFQYIIPEGLKGQIDVGSEVSVPFGRSNRMINGYVIGLSDVAQFDESKLKAIEGVPPKGMAIESRLIRLAAWIKENCGSTMIQALKTVLPVKKKIEEKVKKTIIPAVTKEELIRYLEEFTAKKNVARVRLLSELMEEESLDYDLVKTKLKISPQTLKGLEEKGIIKVESRIVRRNPVREKQGEGYNLTLNASQQAIADDISSDTERPDAYLIHGITGSGKTEVYMELIDRTIEEGKQTIMLIPEIALTYQTVKRFYKRFGDRVSIMNSRLSQGERYDQFEKAKTGETDIIIGPRSALFTPFPNLGLIIIDEEHESSYKSETVPRYHARDVAIALGKMCDAKVVLGSATPTVESFYAASKGRFKLYTMTERATGGELADTHVVDMRQELRNGNKSIISNKLRDLITDRLDKKEQIMLFINRRGYESFVSCRACGKAVKCPHCDVALTEHGGGKLVCHYCGYEEPFDRTCKFCGSHYVAGFKAGTQKIEKLVKEQFPKARVLRMDADTTSAKDGHEKILAAFADKEADILIGTQMIVKGHDFSNVTLVGILAADLSLYAANYMSGERTFQLLTQAAGRAGRGLLSGEVVIQTYSPDNYAIIAAANQDYESFYDSEIMFRQLMEYPPVNSMLLILISSLDEDKAKKGAGLLADTAAKSLGAKVIGPADAPISRVKDMYKQVVYVKGDNRQTLVDVKNYCEETVKNSAVFADCSIIYDFNPISFF